jgi:hypothetical protein
VIQFRTLEIADATAPLNILNPRKAIPALTLSWNTPLHRQNYLLQRQSIELIVEFGHHYMLVDP